MGGACWGGDGDVGCCGIVFCGVFSVVVMFFGSMVSSVFMISRSILIGGSFDALEMVVTGTRTDEVSTIIESEIVEVSALEDLHIFWWADAHYILFLASLVKWLDSATIFETLAASATLAVSTASEALEASIVLATFAALASSLDLAASDAL